MREWFRLDGLGGHGLMELPQAWPDPPYSSLVYLCCFGQPPLFTWSLVRTERSPPQTLWLPGFRPRAAVY